VKVPLASSTPLLAALLWVAALLADPGDLAPPSVLMAGLGLLGTATVGMVGMILTGGRWARRTTLASVGSMVVLAVVRPIDAIWIVALMATALSAIALFSPALTHGIRKLPAASGPPERAVLVPLLLIGYPFALGVAAWDGATAGTLVVGLGAPVAAMWYARVLPGGLYAVRYLWPALAIGLSLTQGLAPGAMSALGGALVATLAWHPSVKVAFHPPREAGTAYPLPPELAPKEILDAANLDDRGRPRA
jgi:hypothetical protein